MSRVPFYFTYVTYERGDWFGYLMAIACLAPHAITIALFAFLIAVASRRLRMQIGVLLVGQFLNEALNVVLKHWIKEPRPMNERIDYAMPSSHAQYAGFIAIAGWKVLRCNPAIHSWISFLGMVACLGVYAVVPYSRLYLDYHDIRQITVGLLVGTLFGLIWRKLSF